MAKPEENGADLLAQARASVARALKSIDRCIARVDKDLEAEAYDTKLASHLVYLTNGTIASMEALRKLEAHDTKHGASLSPEQRDELISAYIADMPRDRRNQFRAMLDQIDEDEQLL